MTPHPEPDGDNLDRFRVGDPFEIVVEDVPQCLEDRLVDPEIEELHVVGAVLQDIADDVLDQMSDEMRRQLIELGYLDDSDDQ